MRIYTHDYLDRTVIVPEKVLAARLSLQDIGLYVQVCVILDFMVEGPDISDVVRELAHGRLGDEVGEAALLAGVQRLIDAGIFVLEPHDDRAVPAPGLPQ
ncbi:hypothetical protein AMK16_32420 [Streptomyces sp. CB00455]|uniref:hypothetical protein n=1 Tax=Streptomyces sp. CB00455 TaxID=1703927 RepID=UPI00093C815F|nr:hypothetical protein [Streptomyces sp. CB00455]OKK12247.1 hypothetical protein AMK16_32420 [Streptomyces sp. CB00455]